MKQVWMLVACALLLTACGGNATFTASGKLGIVAADSTTDDCKSGTGGYNDIREGATLVVYDASDKKLAVGSLKAGKAYGKNGLCVFDFNIPDIPSGKGPYGIEVNSRGQVSFAEKQADDIAIAVGN